MMTVFHLGGGGGGGGGGGEPIDYGKPLPKF